jgi:hypothetical protein
MPLSRMCLGVVLAVCLVTCASPAAAQPDPAGRLAMVSVGAGSVRFAPATGSGLRLTVSGPDGRVFHQQMAPGQSVVFHAADRQGASRPDGVYRYEVRRMAAGAPRTAGRAADGRTAAGVAVADDGAAGSRGDDVIQSGAFTMSGGQFVAPGAEEPLRRGPAGEPTPSDVVHADDLIVQASICAGFDCVNGEVFDFATILLKENNLRIKFDDTSVTAGFAANDWQLTANDSTSGGASKFSIEDLTGAKVPFTITAGARTNALFVSDNGRVGIGTATPGLGLHEVLGDTPGLRLDQAGGPWPAYVWDVAGNEANFFVRDVTAGSTLPFRIKPGAPTSSLTVTDVGVGVGTWTPERKLDVVGDVRISGSLEVGGTVAQTKAGTVPKAAFTGVPKRAMVTFAAPFADAGYVVTLTAVVNSLAATVMPAVFSQTAGGFTITLRGTGVAKVVSVHWVARPAGE